MKRTKPAKNKRKPPKKQIKIVKIVVIDGTKHKLG